MRPELSIVGPVYQGAESIELFYRQCTDAAVASGVSHEIVIVDDGSTDGTFEVLRRLRRDDPRLRPVRLSRNFGHHAAVTAGLDRARGERVFLLDSDLQDDPALLPRFLEEIEASGADVVYGYQERRRGGLFERLSGDLFWGTFNRLSKVRVPRNLLNLRLMSRRYVDALLSLRESGRFLGGMYHWVGFPQRGIPVRRRPRSHGRSTYSLSRKLELAFSAFTSFSAVPLQLAARTGLAITVLGVGVGGYIVLRKLLYPASIVSGWASLGSGILILGGLNMFMTGMVGLYLARVYEQVKGRPLYVVMEDVVMEEEGESAMEDPEVPNPNPETTP